MTALTAVFQDLVRVEIRLWNALDARLRTELGLTLTFYELLDILEETGSCRVADLAESLAVTSSGTSRIIDRMEGEGLVRRAANAADRRSSLIDVTTRGRRKHDEAAAVVEAVLAEFILPHLDAPSIRGLGTALEALREATAG
ncbi:DNA-binding transcriptional regulator, MarR family [Propionibacterium cyclohexanicum]|uniref:DNA-binding transcriptional regulator, MarR family n=1 Tax=Propionibacterium cyclohexanicum TaxID=64702 RepID=A0A1H9TI03_9ACTN|nr:MarR family transcriptional regulator [Propionibacterium cyclohexanicum]SER96716.1 DNA-binding transcriptional regulator, MarR family [Propionibacterium cyclohexanicum]